MVLILSTSAIIGAKISAVPHFLTGLPFWIVASGNIGAAFASFRRRFVMQPLACSGRLCFGNL